MNEKPQVTAQHVVSCLMAIERAGTRDGSVSRQPWALLSGVSWVIFILFFWFTCIS